MGFPSRADFEIVFNAHATPGAVVARRDFLRNERMCRVSGQLLPYRSRQTRRLMPGIHLYDPLFCGLIEHACEPNVFLDMSELWLWALQDIHAGERLTLDISATEDKLLRQFVCGCGASRCRGWITGFDESPNPEGLRFLQGRRRQP